MNGANGRREEREYLLETMDCAQKMRDADILEAHKEALEAAEDGDVSMLSHVFNSTFTLNPALCSLLFQISYEAAYENIRAQQKAERRPHITATPPAYNHNTTSALFYACAACELLKCYPCNTAMPAECYKFRGATRAPSHRRPFITATPPRNRQNAARI